MNLVEKEFLGVVLSNEDTKNLDQKRKGRYKVHIPDIMPHIDPNSGIFVKNHLHKWRITSSKYGEYGQYFPIQPDTQVIIKFHENDMNSGYIDRIVSDFRDKTDVLPQDCVEEIQELLDRDEKTILFKTPKYWSIFYVNEKTNKEPNTMYLIYNRDKESTYTSRTAEKKRNRRTVVRIDETGIHVWTADNSRIRIKLDENKQIDGDQTEYVVGNSTKHIDKDYDIHSHKDFRINVDNHHDVWVRGERTTNIDKDDIEHIKQISRTLIDKDRHEWIKNNKLELIDQDKDEHIKNDYTSTTDNDSNISVNGEEIKNVKGNINTQSSGSYILEVDGTCNISVNGTCNIKSNTSINITGGPMINLNCAPPAPYVKSKKSRPAKDAEYPEDTPTSKTDGSYEQTRSDPTVSDVQDGNHRFNRSWTNDGYKHADFSKAKTKVRDLGPNETDEYELEDEYSGEDRDKKERKQVVGKKCDDVTDDYNIKGRESLDGNAYYEGSN